MAAAEDFIEGLIKEQEQLARDRSSFESHWQEIAQRVFPAYSGAFTSGGIMQPPGTKRNQEVYDSTPVIALQRFAAVSESLLTPRNDRWHGLIPANPELKKDRRVRIWHDAATDALFRYRYAPKANFASQTHQNYMALGAFGSGTLFIDELADEPGLRYKHVHLGEIYFVENHQGIVDKAIRKFPLTARQAYQKWGDRLPADIKNKLSQNSEEIFYFIHCVKPRGEVDPVRKDYKGMPLASYYVSITGKQLLSEGGYKSFPFAISRYVQIPGETYGRSPAMDVLPAIKTLNEQSKTVLKQGHRTVDPIYLLHDDGVLDTFSALPGSMVSGGMSAEGRPLVGTLPVGNVQIGKDLMDDQRAIIRDAFFVTLFQILTDSPEMTATEVLERVREKGILLAPTMARQQSEFLGPLIDRELDLLSRQGLLPPMPPALLEARGEYNVRYDSPLARMQKAGELAGTQRVLQFSAEIFSVTQDPSLFDAFDFDSIQRDMAEGQGMPAKHLVDDKTIQQRREARAKQAQIQQAVEAAPAAAGVVKAMGGGS